MPAVTVAIIGSGFGGLCMAIQLKREGIDDFVVLEKADRVGGTWRDNDYPGAACDVQSHLYSYSFAPKSDWSRKFAGQAEIRAYLEHCVRRYALAAHLRLACEVLTVAFDEQAQVWRLGLADGRTLRARIVVTACGQLNRPALPAIPGIASFRGPAFHSAQWDHSVDLRERSVAVIGTGASAIQFVPQIVPQVARLSLFQRSGAWVIPKADRPFSRVEQWAFAGMPGLDRLYRTLIYWKNESRAIAFTRFAWLLVFFKWQSLWMMRRQVRDPQKRRQLRPDYPIGCKRLLLSNDWFAAIDDARVELVTEAIHHIESDAVVTADGRRHAVDTLIYGTGFQATDFLAPMSVTGVGGRDLNAAWREGAEAYLGICVNGFPNLFMLYGPNTNLAHSSIVFMLESQVRLVLQAVRSLLEPGVGSMQVKAERQRAWSTRLQQRLTGSIWDAGCTSWYKTAAGKNTVNWPGFTFTYRWLTRRLREADFDWQPAPR